MRVAIADGDVFFTADSKSTTALVSPYTCGCCHETIRWLWPLGSDDHRCRNAKYLNDHGFRTRT